MNSYRRGSLDDLRAIAITLVVLMHGYAAFFPRPDSIDNPLLILIYAGGTGVTLFFILSGYLVSMPFIKAAREGQTYSASEHFKQRALRILPTYYFYVLIGCLITGKFDQLAPALFFLANGNDLGVYSNVWWSLATEVQFYLAIPFIFYVSRHVYSLLLLGLLWLSTYLYCTEYLPPGELKRNAWVITSIIYMAPAFLVGMALAWLSATNNTRIRSRTVQILLHAACIIALTFFLQHRAENDRPGYTAAYPYDIAIESILWGGVFYLFLQNRSSVFMGAGRFLSKISFSLYLVHYPIIFSGVVFSKRNEISGYWEGLTVLIVTLGISIFLAWLSYKAIEEPFLRLKEKLRLRRKDSVGDVFP